MPVLPPKVAALDADGLRAQPEHTDVELVDLDLAAEKLTGLSLETVRVKGCRLEGAELRRLRLADVVVRQCRLRLAKLSHLRRPHALLEACDLRGALLMESDLSDTRFAACDLSDAELFNVDLQGSDLRDNELAGLRGVGCLRGATVDALQLLALGPALATHVGLIVEEAVGEGV
jgi:uncharacterized protein YjbI with pentapeptide repeats